MNKKFTPDELSAHIYYLLETGDPQNAIDMCTAIAEDENESDLQTTALLLRAYSRMAAGDSENALTDHREACRNAAGMLPAEQLAIAEESLDANMPFDYCAELFSAAGERFEQEENDCTMAAGAYNKAGICLFRHGASSEEEKACFIRALDTIKNADDDCPHRDKLEILSALVQSNLAECLAREGRREEAVKFYRQSADTFGSRLNDDGDICLTHYAICQRCLSDLYRASEENIQAHSCLSKSITELERRSSKLSDQLRMHLAVCYNARGTLRFQMGDYEGEVSDCTRSLELREGMDEDPCSVAIVLSNRAEAYAMLEHFDRAREDFLRSVDMFDSVENNGQAAASAATRCYSLGMMYAEKDQLKAAADAFRSAAERLARLRSSGIDDTEYTDEQLCDIESLSRMRLASILTRLDERDYFDSITESREALRLIERLPLTVDRAARMSAIHTSVAEVLELFDELDAAQQEYELADRCRMEGLELIMSGACPDYSEKDAEEQFNDERSIWENFSDDTPQA